MPLATGKPEEVNAWGTYESTARNARSFRQGGGGGNTANTTRRRKSATLTGGVHGNDNNNINYNLSSSVQSRRSSLPLQEILEEFHNGGNNSSTNVIDHEEISNKIMTPKIYNNTLRRSGFFESFNWEHGVSIKHLENTIDCSSSSDQFRPTTANKKEHFERILNDQMKLDFAEICSIYIHDDGNSNGFDASSSTYTPTFFSLINATMPWVQPWLKTNFGGPTIKTNPFLFIDACLRGISQVYFQNNPISGILILIGLFIQSTRIAVHGVISVMVGNLLAYLIGFDTGLIHAGLFGYNSVLVGLALATFDPTGTEHSGYQVSIILGSIICAAFTSILFVFLGKLLVPYKSPPLTLPFNIATLIFLFATANMARVNIDSVRTPSLPDYGSDTNSEILNVSISTQAFFAGTIRGIGQVFLCNKLASGLCIWAGIAVCSRIGAIAAFVGSMLGGACALAMGVPIDAIENGLFGFNASLSVTAMLMFYSPSYGASVFAAMAGIMTVLGQQALANLLQPFGLPFMTLPFCVIALPFIIVQGTTSIAVAIPLASLTVPEDHLKRVTTLADGFYFLQEAIQTSTLDQLKKQKQQQDDNKNTSKKEESDARNCTIKEGDNEDEEENDEDNDFVGDIESQEVLKRKVSVDPAKNHRINASLKQMSSIVVSGPPPRDSSLKGPPTKSFTSQKPNLTSFQSWLGVQLQRPKNGNEPPSSSSSSIRRGTTSVEDPWVHECSREVFETLNSIDKAGHLSFQDVTDALQIIGVGTSEGLHFASLVLHLMDQDKSESIDEDEFVAFCLLSIAIQGFRKQIWKFFDFVDLDQNGSIEFEEIDSALVYLGRPTMSQEDKDDLIAVMGEDRYDENEGINVMDLINFVTVSKIKTFVDAYHGSGNDPSGRNDIRNITAKGDLSEASA